MPFLAYNRIWETTRTTGTGNLALDGAAPNYEEFARRFTEGDRFPYLVESKLMLQWEIGIGEFQTTDVGTGTTPGTAPGTGTGPGSILIRHTVLSSSNNDALVDFGAGIKDVKVILPAENVVMRGETGFIGSTVPRVDSDGNLVASDRAPAYTQTYNTASRTHPDLTSATLTDSTGGSANTTLEDVTSVGVADPAKCNNNFADLVAQNNALRNDLEDLKKVVNQIIDDFQSYQFFQ